MNACHSTNGCKRRTASRTRPRSTPPATAKAPELASDLSDSGLETQFIALMRGIGVSVRQQVWIDDHPVDTLIGERLVVQLDGFGFHNRAVDRRRDITADVRLRLLGYSVLRFDYQQVLFHPEYVQESIRMAMAQGLHRPA